ncbi:MAG: valine--tRNA ligase [Clostridia bacterium]
MEKKYDFTQIEKQMQKFWEAEEIYRFRPDGREIYSIDTPPPTVSGKLHIGHLFSYTQAEIIARFHRMQGENVFYPFGFDDNGLPTERLIERETQTRAASLPRAEFIKLCDRTAEKYETEFREFWKSLGFSTDWSLQYRTSEADVRKISQELFLELVAQGKAYLKESPVLWCTSCRTSVAQAELDTADVESAFYYLPFFVGDTMLPVATTRPELLYGCVCLFVHPKDERYREWVGKTALVPLYRYEIPIRGNEKVDMEKGTGAVMCATFGDAADAEWFAEYGLPYRKVFLPDGLIAQDVPFLAGMPILEARKEILRLLRERGLLLKSEPITHTVGIHERCGREIEILPSRQWYIDILTEKERFRKAADEIRWYPANMKNRYIAWVENLKWDWCISRQRSFGIPFPVWYCKTCGAPVFAKHLPVDPAATPYEGKCACGGKDFVPETAVFDTWATSSLTPQINERLGIPLAPMCMRTHAHEIIRTWTFYTIVRSLYHTGRLPWKDLMICGFVLAKKGEKISKSKGNDTYDPNRLIAVHSADALRYWTAGTRLGTDTLFAEEELSQSKRFLTKLWNAARFAFSHLEAFTPEPKPVLLPADRWMLERTKSVTMEAARLLRAYEIGPARTVIDELFWKDFCDHYLELVKERLYRPDLHGAAERRSGQFALYHTLLNILKLYAPYVPHITEYLYQTFYRRHETGKSIHLLQWEKPEKIAEPLLDFGERLKSVLAEMRRYKTERGLSMRAELARLEIRAGAYREWFALTEKDLKACSNALEIVYI